MLVLSIREQPCLPVLEATALDRADFVKAAAAVLVATSGVTSSQAAEVSGESIAARLQAY